MDGSERCVCHESFRYVRTQLTHTHTQTHAQTQAKHSSQVRIHTRTINKPLAFLSQDFKGAHTHKQDTITQDTNTHTHRHKHRHKQTWTNTHTQHTQSVIPINCRQARSTHAQHTHAHNTNTLSHTETMSKSHTTNHIPPPPHPHTPVSFQSNDVKGAQNSEFLLLFSSFISCTLHPVPRDPPPSPE